MPKTLTAADFLSLRMQYRAARAENEWPAAIEHDFAGKSALKCRRKNSANCCKTTAWPCPANRVLCPTRRKRRREQTNAPQKQPKCPVPAFFGF